MVYEDYVFLYMYVSCRSLVLRMIFSIFLVVFINTLLFFMIILVLRYNVVALSCVSRSLFTSTSLTCPYYLHMVRLPSLLRRA